MNRFLFSLGVLVIVGLILAGCGASVAPTQAPTLARDSGSVPSMAPVAPAPLPAATRVASSESTTQSNASAGSVTDRLIIRNGSLTLTVKDVTDVVGKVTALANASGGFVLRTDSRYQGEALIATVTIKVPAESFDSIIADLRKMAIKVDAENTSSQDVTEEYVDLAARLKVYEATEQQLMTFLQKTQNVDESLKVYRELNNVRSQIESAKGRMDYLQKSAAMSTLTVQIKPEDKEKPIIKEEGWDPLRIVRDALRWLVSALQYLFNVLVFVVFGVIPVLLAVAIPLLILRAFWRWLRRRRAK